MPFRMMRWLWFGRPVRGLSGGSSGSKRRHCASIKSVRLTRATWELRSRLVPLCRHAVALQLLEHFSVKRHGTCCLSGGGCDGWPPRRLLLRCIDQVVAAEQPCREYRCDDRLLIHFLNSIIGGLATSDD